MVAVQLLQQVRMIGPLEEIHSHQPKVKNPDCDVDWARRAAPCKRLYSSVLFASLPHTLDLADQDGTITGYRPSAAAAPEATALFRTECQEWLGGLSPSWCY